MDSSRNVDSTQPPVYEKERRRTGARKRKMGKPLPLDSKKGNHKVKAAK